MLDNNRGIASKRGGGSDVRMPSLGKIHIPDNYDNLYTLY